MTKHANYLMTAFVLIILFSSIANASIPEIDWHDAEDYIGKYVSAKGKIVSARNTGNVCYLNFDKNYKNTLSVVVFKGDFPKFPQSPEIYYLNKTVRAKGKISKYKGLLQIIIKNPSEVKILKNDTQGNENHQTQSIVSTNVITGHNFDTDLTLTIALVLVTCIIVLMLIFNFRYRQTHKNIINAVRETVGEEVGKAIPQMLDAISHIHNVDSTEKIANTLSKNYGGRFLHNERIRNEFLQILKSANSEVDIICPWLSENALDRQVLELFESSLDTGVIIKILYGYQGGSNDEKSNALAEQLWKMYSKHDDRFSIKRINTHAKLLLCDKDVMMVGSYNLLSFGGKYTKETRNEMMMLLNNQELVQKLRKTHFNF